MTISIGLVKTKFNKFASSFTKLEIWLISKGIIKINLLFFIYNLKKSSKFSINFLVDKSKEKEIWVEYGIQSFFDETLVRINRGDSTSNMKYWINRTKEKGLNVCGHLIYGLPDETQEMMLETFRETVKLKVDSIKFHPLYVVKNTLLTNEYKKGKFTPITEELYIDTVVKSIKELPSNISIQRITAGIDDDTLLAPQWCRNKHQQIKNIRSALEKEGFNY